MFLDIARNRMGAPTKPAQFLGSVDELMRDIRAYSAQMFDEDLSREPMDLVASMIE